MSLFEGYKNAYGYYSGNLVADDSGKHVGQRGSIVGPVTTELWVKHITGVQGLGVIPITDHSEIKFAAIDIDQYDINLVSLNKVMQDKKLPLVVCKTKSGGAHLYLFLSKFANAKQVQQKMRDIASILGYGGCEIFPKQTEIVAERGDVGNWINMPYFNAVATTRYAIGEDGKALDIRQFIAYAQSRVIDPEKFLSLAFEEVQLLPGGPPCLNHLCGMGFPNGTRNNGLLNLGVYAKKSQPEDWERLLDQLNQKYMDPPLGPEEVLGVIKSLKKKEFFYMCKQVPISQYCNMPKCRLCKHGIGGANVGMPKFGTLAKLRTDPPVWFLSIEGGGRIELDTEELQNQRKFQLRLMETLNIMPGMMKQDAWQEIVHELLKTCTMVDVPEESTPRGQLKQHLVDYCTGRVQAKNPGEMIMGKPWSSNGRHYIRIKDFLEYLYKKRFNYLQENKIVMLLREWSDGTKFWNLKGTGINTISFKEFPKQTEDFDVEQHNNKVAY